MASTTGLPQHTPAHDGDGDPASEQQDASEPLLGQPGDAQQRNDAPIAKNLILGTGIVAEGASVLLVASVWASVFLHGPLILFSAHPLAQSVGVVMVVQSILVVQPTHTGPQKRTGQLVHAGLNAASLAAFAVGVGSIEYNKVQQGPGSHFHSVHGYLGVAAAVVLALQYLVGFTMLALPVLYGGDANAKRIWKYHRMSGYLLLLLLLATVCSATDTGYNQNVLGLKLWAMIVISVLLVIGVYPRIRKAKLGL